MAERLGMQALNWVKAKKIALDDPDRMASVLMDIGLSSVIQQQLERKWSVEDVLLDRYRTLRGRAIAGQQRGRSLENEVEKVLREATVPFERGVTFVGKKGEKAKCDFAVPSRDHPKIVIEAKGFEATGSKLTDFLGDVLKIVSARESHAYFFLVTDGRGWHNRQSDLKKLVEFHRNGDIDMIYTLSRLTDLQKSVKTIIEKE
jgi:hypothetical protein